MAREGSYESSTTSPVKLVFCCGIPAEWATPRGAKVTMKVTRLCTAQMGISALASAAIFADCNSGTQSSLSRLGTAQNGSHRVEPLATVSNVVQIDNEWTQTVLGSGSATCWSISPTPLPAVGPSASSPPVTLSYDTTCPVTLSYDTTCPVTATLPITYGPGTTPL
jgi:hypothetical protein